MAVPGTPMCVHLLSSGRAACGAGRHTASKPATMPLSCRSNGHPPSGRHTFQHSTQRKLHDQVRHRHHTGPVFAGWLCPGCRRSRCAHNPAEQNENLQRRCQGQRTQRRRAQSLHEQLPQRQSRWPCCPAKQDENLQRRSQNQGPRWRRTQSLHEQLPEGLIPRLVSSDPAVTAQLTGGYQS